MGAQNSSVFLACYAPAPRFRNSDLLKTLTGEQNSPKKPQEKPVHIQAVDLGTRGSLRHKAHCGILFLKALKIPCSLLQGIFNRKEGYHFWIRSP